NLLVPPFLMLCVCILFAIAIAARWSAARLIKKLALFFVFALAVTVAYFVAELYPLWTPTKDLPDAAELATIVALPTLIAWIGTRLLMGQQGARAFKRALAISVFIAVVFTIVDQFWFHVPLMKSLVRAWPWGLNAPWSVPLAFAILGL